MEALAGGSSTPFHGHHRPQKPGISPKCKEVKTPAGSLGPLLHPLPVFPLTVHAPDEPLHTWTHTPSSRPCEAPSGGPWMNRSASPSLTEPAPLGGPEGKTYVPTSKDFPSGLPACFPGLWDTQAASVLSRFSKLGTGGQYGPGCLPVRSWMLSLCHLKLHITYPPES